jgi:hypothetical protein
MNDWKMNACGPSLHHILYNPFSSPLIKEKSKVLSNHDSFRNWELTNVDKSVGIRLFLSLQLNININCGCTGNVKHSVYHLRFVFLFQKYRWVIIIKGKLLFPTHYNQTKQSWGEREDKGAEKEWKAVAF